MATDYAKKNEAVEKKQINLAQVSCNHDCENDHHVWAQIEPEAANQGSPKGQEKKNGVGAAEEVKNKDAERKLCGGIYHR